MSILRIARNPYTSLLINFLYAAGNCIIGFLTHSWWFITVGAYYAILAITRFAVLQIQRNTDTEAFVKRITGVLLVVLSFCIIGVNVLSIVESRGTEFHKIIMIAIATYTFTVIVYLLFPNMQELRPAEFPRDNFLTRFMAGYYEMDTNTNVLPSLHVIGAFAVQTAAWHSKRLGTPLWRTVFTVTAVLISLSTVFLKQHSILDVFAGLLVCLPAYLLIYLLPLRKNKKKGLVTVNTNP